MIEKNCAEINCENVAEYFFEFNFEKKVISVGLCKNCLVKLHKKIGKMIVPKSIKNKIGTIKFID